MAQRRIYPLGIQTFSEIREGGYVYVDKSAHVYRMTRPGLKYVFLSRPRRFGKSLLTSTLRCYFEGRSDLFKGLAIDGLEREWTDYPVVQLDMSQGQHLSKEDLELYIFDMLKDNEKRLGVESEGATTNLRLKNLIVNACRKTGKRVVVLIDEYDAPLLNVVNEDANLPVLRDALQNFYRPLKGCDPYLRFVFLTGITKFSQLSIFSALNNIKNISMDKEFADICGISAEEMLTQLSPDIDLLAESLGKSSEETIRALRRNYDGYHFTWPSPDIYNPYSLLNAFSDGKIDAYWFGSGTPTYLIEMLRKFKVMPQEIGGRSCKASSFDAPTEHMTDITPLLYQSGYITIKGYSAFKDRYTLDIPNREVRIGLMESLIPSYVRRQDDVKNLAGDMAELIYYGDMDGALRLAQKVLRSIPYCDNANTEGHYQAMLYLLFTLMGQYVDVEVRTATGRIDMVLRAPDRLYIIELKLRDDAETALQQIDLKQYGDRFALCNLPIVKVGISFDTATRTISDWKIM